MEDFPWAEPWARVTTALFDAVGCNRGAVTGGCNRGAVTGDGRNVFATKPRIGPDKSFYTGQSVGRVAANPQIAVFFFRSTMNTPGG